MAEDSLTPACEVCGEELALGDRMVGRRKHFGCLQEGHGVEDAERGVWTICWGDDRVVVVDAPSRESVQRLLSRHTCGEEECEHCTLFRVLDGQAGITIGPRHIRTDGRFYFGLGDLLEKSIPLVFVLGPFALLLTALRAASSSAPFEPRGVRWPAHP